MSEYMTVEEAVGKARAVPALLKCCQEAVNEAEKVEAELAALRKVVEAANVVVEGFREVKAIWMPDESYPTTGSMTTLVAALAELEKVTG